MSAFRATLLGGVDGVVTSFTVVAGVYAGGLAQRVALIVGTSSVLADGLSMGVSEFLSSESTQANIDNNASVQDVRGGRAPAWWLGILCFTSFVICGAVPIVTFLLSNGSLLATAMFSLVELMLLGAGRTLQSREPLLLGLFQTSLLGAAAGGVAYGVAHWVALVE